MHILWTYARQFNSCRNRHCPKCQQIQRERWIQAREAELLPATYFHVVFTLPQALNKLCLFEPAKVYKLLFDTAWSVMKSFARDEKHLGAETGMISILHTWGQNLSLHPHIHCIVPAGGLTRAGFWNQARGDGKFLFPVKAMSPVFRARFVSGLRNRIKGLDRAFYNDLFKTDWVVYAKAAFAGPKQVIEYLGRYTHKIAISNHGLLNITDQAVTFLYKDYRDASKKKIMTLETLEFIRRFSLHSFLKASCASGTMEFLAVVVNRKHCLLSINSSTANTWCQIPIAIGRKTGNKSLRRSDLTPIVARFANNRR
jgi:hypothetical protein